MLTVKPLEKFEMCFMSGNELQTQVTPLTHKHTCDTVDTQTHM